jgi:ERCC4-type nuclease
MAAALPRLVLGHHCLAPEPSDQLRDLIPGPGLPCISPRFRFDPENPIIRPSLQGMGIGGAWCFRECTDATHARPFFVASGPFAAHGKDIGSMHRPATTNQLDACMHDGFHSSSAGLVRAISGDSATIDLLDTDVELCPAQVPRNTDVATPFLIPGTSYRVVLIVDNIELRRYAGHTGATVAESILSSLRDLSVPFVVVDLPIGDFLWVAAPVSSRKDYFNFKLTAVSDPWWREVRMLGYIVERKRTNDLYHSMRKLDHATKMRYTDQKEALLLCGLTRLVYLLENDSSVIFKTHTGKTAAYVSPFDLPSSLREAEVDESTKSFAKTIALDIDVDAMHCFAMTETQAQGFSVVGVPGAVETVEWLHDMSCAIALQAAGRRDWDDSTVGFLVWRQQVEFVRKVVLPRMRTAAAPQSRMSDLHIAARIRPSSAHSAQVLHEGDDDIIDLCDPPAAVGVKRSRSVFEAAAPKRLRLLTVPGAAGKITCTILLSSGAHAKIGEVLRAHYDSRGRAQVGARSTYVALMEDSGPVVSAAARFAPGFDIAWSRGPPAATVEPQPLYIKLMSGKEYVSMIESFASTVVEKKNDFTAPDRAQVNYMKLVAAWRTQFPTARCITLVYGLPDALTRYDKARKFRIDAHNFRNFHVHGSVWMEWEVVILKSEKELIRYLIYMTAALEKLNPNFFPTLLSNCR